MVTWNLRGYTTKNLEHLSLPVVGPARLLVLAYLLQETHLPTSTLMLGSQVDYSVL